MRQERACFDDESLDVIQQIAEHDGMYQALPDVYFEAGREALRSARLALLAANATRVDRILDFASGAGRVLRYLKAAFPDAQLTACDVLSRDLEFCAEVFGAAIVEGKRDPVEVELEGQFDLVWCGSLLSHTAREDFAGFLKLFDSVLSPEGVVVFTTMGRSVAEALRSGTSPLPLSRDEAEQVVHEYDNTGFGFSYGVHDPQDRLGEAVASPAWVCDQVDRATELRLLLYMEQGWVGQDIIACTSRSRR